MKHQAHTHTRFKDEIRMVLIVHGLAPIALLVAVFLSVLAFVWNDSIIRNTERACEEVSAQLSATGNAYLEKVSQVANQASQDGENSSRADFNGEIYSFLNSQPIRGAFYLLKADGGCLFTTEHDPVIRDVTASQLQRFLPRLSAQTPHLTYCRYPFLGGARADLQLGQAISRGNDVVGYAIFVLPDEVFAELVNSHNGAVIIANRYGHVFTGNSFRFHTNLDNLAGEVRTASGYLRYDNERFFVRQKPVLGGYMRVYAVANCSGMIQILLLTFLFSAVIFLAMAAAIFFSANTIARRKTKIIDEIAKAFLDAQSGRLDNYLHVSTNDEFKIIGDSYNSMLDSLRDLMRRNKEQAQETVLSTIKQLESQFNPHFLFNTLENVRFMIRLDPQAANRMIICLCNLLRYSIQDVNSCVTMEEDLNSTQNYLAILKYRFGDRFNYRIQIPDKLRNCMVPKLIFQPIIENAVKYGMADRPSVTVCIDAVDCGADLEVVIQDDGTGIPPDTLAEIWHNLKRPRNETGNIGIYNVHRRLTLMYGEQYGLEIDSQGRGTIVRMRLSKTYQSGRDDENAESVDCGG